MNQLTPMDDALLYAKIEQLDGLMAETPLILRPLDILRKRIVLARFTGARSGLTMLYV